MKATLLLSALFLSITGIQAQQCNCKTSYEWVKKTFEDNDAGYAHILAIKGQDAYALHNKLTAEKVEKINDTDSCLKALENWVRFFRTDHFRFTKTQAPVNTQEKTAGIAPLRNEPINTEQFRKYLLERKTPDTIEGIWETPYSTIAIKKENNEYTGILLSSSIPNRKAGDTRFSIATNLGTARLYQTGARPTQVNKIRTWGKQKQVLQLDNLLLKKIFPTQQADSNTDEYYRVKTAAAPFGYKRDSNTVYIHINSFNYENKQAIDSVLKSLDAAITSTPNLIIDLRDCQGGTDQSFHKLIPYLYTNPIRQVMAEFYSTPLNNRMWKEVANREGLDAEEKAQYQKINALMDSKLGKYVNIFGKDVDTIRLNKVLPYPRNIGIIIHENNFSTTEEFILAAKQSKKVKFFGRKTGGALDVSNMVEAKDPSGNFIFEYCISRSLRIPDFPVDDMGLHPDFYLDRYIPEDEWIAYTSMILNYHNAF